MRKIVLKIVAKMVNTLNILGYCTTDKAGVEICTCYPGWTGASCQIIHCPTYILCNHKSS